MESTWVKELFVPVANDLNPLKRWFNIGCLFKYSWVSLLLQQLQTNINNSQELMLGTRAVTESLLDVPSLHLCQKPQGDGSKICLAAWCGECWAELTNTASTGRSTHEPREHSGQTHELSWSQAEKEMLNTRIC